MSGIMIDLETLGSGPEALIATLAAVPFDPALPGDGVPMELARYWRVHLSESGGQMDASTVRWWLGRSKEAREEITTEADRVPLSVALSELHGLFVRTQPDQARRQCWGCGASFDCVVLRQAYKRDDGEAPWPYWGDRCYRTLRAMWPGMQPAPEVPHHALHDAAAQARHAVTILRAWSAFKAAAA